MIKSHELVVFAVCLTITHAKSRIPDHKFCVETGTKRTCYAVYSHPRLTQVEAAAYCGRHHVNGRLATILDETTQEHLERNLQPSDDGFRGYWLGARLELQLLKNWTWVDGESYSDSKQVQFPDYDKHGYISLRRSTSNGSSSFRMSVVPISDPPQNDAQALCECSESHVSDCIVNGERYYAIGGVRRWYEARSICSRYSQSDLAVLPLDDKTFNISELGLLINTKYFIGMRNVRLVWNLTGSEKEAKYTNWADSEPAEIYDVRKPVCIYIYSFSWKWNTDRCKSVSMGFICENEQVPQPDNGTNCMNVNYAAFKLRTTSYAVLAQEPSILTDVMKITAVFSTAVIVLAFTVCCFKRKRKSTVSPGDGTDSVYQLLNDHHHIVQESMPVNYETITPAAHDSALRRNA